MKIINLMPHNFTLYNDAGEVVRVIPPTEPAARVEEEVRIIGDIDGIPVTETVFGDVENLPEPQPDTIYIVSMRVQQAVPHRGDVYRPDTSQQMAVRQGNQIIGVKALAR